MDVVVAGLGVAGASAVVAARQAGGEVLAVERTAGVGGTSAQSGGLIFLGGGTPLQNACGFEDSPENMAAFLHAALGPGQTMTASMPTARAPWSTSTGSSPSACPSGRRFCDEPDRESADDAGLLFSGGEDSYPFHEIATPVPRGHKPQWIDSAGSFLMAFSGRRCRPVRPGSWPTPG